MKKYQKTNVNQFLKSNLMHLCESSPHLAKRSVCLIDDSFQGWNRVELDPALDACHRCDQHAKVPDPNRVRVAIAHPSLKTFLVKCLE